MLEPKFNTSIIDISEEEKEMGESCENCYHYCLETKTCWCPLPAPIMKFNRALTDYNIAEYDTCECWVIRKEGGGGNATL